MTGAGFIYLRKCEAGAATLTITLILLFSLSLITLYSARVSVVEQKIATNEYRAKQAFEAAQAGLEKGIAYVNNPQARKQIIVDIDNDGLIDGQPTNLTSAVLSDDSGYEIRYDNQLWPDDFRLIKINVTGWSDNRSASAALIQTLQIVPLLLVPPDAGITAINNIATDGAVGLINTETDRTIQAGGSITLSAGSHTTTSTEGTSGIQEHSIELQDLSANGDFFEYFFGVQQSTVADQIIRLACDGSACMDRHDNPVNPDEYPGENIWITGNTVLDSDIGTGDQPVVMIVDGDLVLKGDVSIYGLVYITANGRMLEVSDTGFLYGALIVANDDVQVSGDLTIQYTGNVLVPPKGGNGPFVAIAGSWKDF